MAATPAPAYVDVYLVLEGAPVSQSVPALKTGPRLASTISQTQRRGAELMAQHAALQSRLEASGVQVRSHLTRLANALKVRVPADRLASVAALPGVRHVARVHYYKRALTKSVPFIGAPAAWGAAVPHADGAGIRIGVIDTGIDYTHADFGGSGNPDDYGKIDPTRAVPGIFPTSKVVGGRDFAGDDYDAEDPNRSIPHPDPNPLDCAAGGGHGTHVAGIAAGLGVLNNGLTYTGSYSADLNFNQFAIGPGVAPRASLYALKVFGCSGSTDLVADALEWAADPNGDFSFSNRLDVVNLSLGSTFGSQDLEDPDIIAVNNLANLGCVVVCAAGNDGNVFYASGPPSSASRAIAVANSLDTGISSGIQVLSPASIATNFPGKEGEFTEPLAATGAVEDLLVYAQPHDACGDLQNTNALRGHIALIDRGTCFFVDKIQRAQDAGAIAVIMVNNVPGAPIIMGGNTTTINIPGVMISQADGEILKAHLSEKILVTLEANMSFSQLLDNLESSSSRGPVGLANYLKPELAAPGTEIYSAAVASGTNGIAFTGTSMASPTVAGAAAILRQLHPDWSVEEIKAALMNTAHGTHDSSFRPYPESMTGAGRVQVGVAAQTQVTAAAADADGNVALSFGSLVLAAAYQTNGAVVLHNHGTNAVTFQVAVSNTVAQTGVSLVPATNAVTVAGQSSVTVPFTFSADPSRFQLTHDPVTPQTIVGLPRQSLYEASGEIWFLQATQSLHVPYYSNLRAASSYLAGTNTIVLGAEVSTQQLVNVTLPLHGSSSVTNAVLSAFELGAFYPPRILPSPYNSDADLRAVGAASDIATAGSVTNARVFFGLATATSWPTPQSSYVQFLVLIDTNNDGLPDFMLSNGNASQTNSNPDAVDVFLTVVQTLDAAGNPGDTNGAGYLNIYPATQLDTAPFNNSVLIESVPASQIGLSDGHSRFRYQVQASGTLTNLVQTGWISFDAARPAIDTAASGRDGTPIHTDGQPLLVRLDRSAADDSKQRLPGVLLLHHHNLEGKRFEVARLDLSNDDLDHDGLPDWWEMKYFKSLTTADRTTDTDRDGFSDYDEYLAGTDPTDPLSYLKISSAVPRSSQGVLISWPSVAGKTYTILGGSNVTSGLNDFFVPDQLATPPTNTFWDTNVQQSFFYKIQLQ